MFATATSGEVQNTAFCNLSQLVAGLLQKQLCFAIGSNEKNVSLHTATSGEGQNTAFCNLSHVLTKSNFVLQLVVAEKKRCFCLPCPKFCLFDFCTFCFSLQRVFHGIAPRFWKKFCNAVCCGEGKCQPCHVFCATSAKGQKHLFQLVNFFRGRFPLPFVFHKLPFVLQNLPFVLQKIAFCFAKFTVVFQTTKLTANERQYLAKIRAEKLFRGRFWAIK